MGFEGKLSVRNLKRRPVRTTALVLISAFLTLSVFAGSVVITSLGNGLKSYEKRLGADIVAVPYEARTKGEFESILLQGIPGTFYMKEEDYEKIRRTGGIEAAAPEFYLASASAGCCSAAVQIIGFDPEQDFTVQPWIREKYTETLGRGDIIVGSELVVPKDGKLTFYDTECTVAAKLDRTGTGLDTAVYANMDTIRDMITNARKLGFTAFDDIDPDHAVSSVMIRVADGCSVEEVADDINIHVRHIEATSAVRMVSGIAGGLTNAARMIRILTAVIWLFAILVLSTAFLMIAHERAKEFAVLRVLGASRGMVSRQILTESAMISAAGSVLGLILASVFVFPFGHMISSALELPYLLPGAGRIALYAAGSFLISVAAGALTSALSVWRISRQDAAFDMREGT